MLLHIDESGFNLNMTKEYGYAQKSKRLLANRDGKRGERVTVIAARNHLNELVAPFVFTGYTNGCVFKFYLKNILLPQIKVGSVLILDNASFHKGEDILNMVQNAHCRLQYLPSYSPDLNPIEKKWAQIKKLYRKFTKSYEDKHELIDLLLSNKKPAIVS